MKLEQTTIGGFLSFAESGKTIDAIVVSAAAFPDDDPAENWDSLGCITEVNFEAEKETDTNYCPSPTGGYDKIDTERVIKDLLKFITIEQSEPYWRLMLGLGAEIVDGVAQMPFASTKRYIEGWLKVTAKGDDGVDRIDMRVWGRLSLDANPKWSKDPTKPALNFQVLYSAIATVTPTSIVA
jgi:hypothetical protein